ncbi:arsenate reductase ArsC [Rhodomicrobium sp. Az07]|uniref:arsenate reductase ArsC n=1 Tax=Rhodomicrobium sp. Az07 TaxID=2839034 RepID=UPI001BEBA305|nr:arsenate reductase ArsC [Rhodomicrobium sp. Az07]MBT3071332.1 arsenate reductase ArsC [Rhodomicrobium sp. Az07]
MSDPLPGDRIFNVLFLCTHNSARSVLAESILNRSANDKFRAFSAGSHPRGQIHPYAIDLLKNLSYDVSGLRSKSWDEFAGPDAPRMDFVFTVCDDAAKEVCPMWPGQPMTAHWGVPDPSTAEGKEAEKRLAFANSYRMLQRRIDVFISLPVKSLARLALQKEIEEIGRMVDAPEKAS